MKVTRILGENISRDLCASKKNKVIVIYGARQVGKTTLVHDILSHLEGVLYLNAEEFKIKDIFSRCDLSSMEEIIGNKSILFIDEAQNVENISLNIKILHDAHPELKIILTGSSSFELANRTAEPLTGRKSTYKLYPISVQELRKHISVFDIKQNIEHYLLYGMYPEVLNEETVEDKKRTLRELSSSYLYKDILMLVHIKHSDKLFKLLQLLALQIGSTASIAKLSNGLDVSFDTVERYLELLEKSFVIFKLSGYSKNKSKEISKMDKYYFYDVGIRNAVLENYSPLSLRTDGGALWENFIISERIKRNEYGGKYGRMYFWRLYSGAEIDYIEEYDGLLHAYEIKFNNKIVKSPKSWQGSYPKSTFETINQDNFLEFVS